jgi:hypothetical protein
LGVIDGNSSQMFPVAEPVNYCLKVFTWALFKQIGLDFVRETLSHYFRSVLQIAAQTPLLKPYFIVGGEQRDQCDPNDQRDSEAKC